MCSLLTTCTAPHLGIITFPPTESCQPHNFHQRHHVFLSKQWDSANPHQKNGQTIPPKGMCHAEHALTATQWPFFTSYSAGAEPSFRNYGGGAVLHKHLSDRRTSSPFLSFFLNCTSFIMEVLCTQMCATASLCRGLGGLWCLIFCFFFLAVLYLFWRLPHSKSPWLSIFLPPGFWVEGRAAAHGTRGEKVVRWIFLCSSSLFLLSSTIPRFLLSIFICCFIAVLSLARDAIVGSNHACRAS